MAAGTSYTRDPAAFRARVGAWLLEDPVRRNVLATVAAGAASGVFAWAETQDGRLRGATAQPRGRQAVLVADDEATAEALMDTLLDAGEPLAGVSGPEPESAQAAAAWRARTGGHVALLFAMDLMLLDGRPQRPAAAGAARAPLPHEHEQLAGWIVEFSGTTGGSAEHARAAVDAGVAAGTLLVWDVDGEAVATASRAQPVGDAVRVNLVYTPVQRRRHGYAAAITAATCEAALDAGAGQCMLFADRANPTAVGVYARLGFRAAQHAGQYRFSA